MVTLIETDAGTEVAIETDLTISGRIAQFGRGVLADVSSKLLGEFARCLEDDLARSDEGADPGMADAREAAVTDGPDANGQSAASAVDAGKADGPDASSHPRTVPSRPSEPLDLLALAGPGMAQRALPAALVVDLVLLAVVKAPAARWPLSAAGTGLVATTSVPS